MRPLKLDAGVTTSAGDLLVADRELKAVVRFSADGRPKGEFVRQVAARRLAITELDDVAALDRDAKTVTLINRDGKIVTRIPDRGTGYQFRQPVDIAFDRLGHIYVARSHRSVRFLSLGPRLVATFTVPEKNPGAFGSPESLALDSAGRLFVFDSRTDKSRCIDDRSSCPAAAPDAVSRVPRCGRLVAQQPRSPQQDRWSPRIGPGGPGNRWRVRRTTPPTTSGPGAARRIIAHQRGPSDVAQRQLLASSFELRGRATTQPPGHRRRADRLPRDAAAGSELCAAGPGGSSRADAVRGGQKDDRRPGGNHGDASRCGRHARRHPSRRKTQSLTLVAAPTPSLRAGAAIAPEQSFTVVPGTPPQTITLMLEREFSTVTFVTAPANVEVVVDGVSRGFTEPDPGAEAQAGVGASASPSRSSGGPAAGAASPRVPAGLLHQRGTESRRRKTGRPQLDMVRLPPAVASVAVSSSAAGGTVFVDDAPRGDRRRC